MKASLYIGTKIVLSTPMTRLQYVEYRGWDLPDNENGEDEGYLVEYTDGGKPNHPDHKGYISWSPKEQHEKAYILIKQDVAPEGKEFQPHQVRVLGEITQLHENMEKLSIFLASPRSEELPAEERALLLQQLRHMGDYHLVLQQRIARF